MTAQAPFVSTFILDKAHFNECYLETNTIKDKPNPYFKSAVLMIFGLCLLLFSSVNTYASWFVVALGILEAVSHYYHQPWWVVRQMLSKASSSEVTVTIDEQGILSESFYHQGKIRWGDITDIAESEVGFVVNFTIEKASGKNYLSKSCLSSEAQTFVREKVKDKLKAVTASSHT